MTQKNPRRIFLAYMKDLRSTPPRGSFCYGPPDGERSGMFLAETGGFAKSTVSPREWDLEEEGTVRSIHYSKVSLTAGQ